jgi:hypothetical protein
VVQRVRVGRGGYVALVSGRRGEGFDPGREMEKTGPLKGLEAAPGRLDANELR